MTDQHYTTTYTQWSGSKFDPDDITGITWSITREAAPVFTMNSSDPRNFKRGKRAYAGAFTSKKVYEVEEVIDQIVITYEGVMGDYATRTVYKVKVLEKTDDGDGYVYRFIADEVGPTVPLRTKEAKL